MAKELLKGNVAFAEAAIRAGCEAYFGYPITPQTEIMEYLMSQKPEERTGMVVLQAESELAAINMIYGGAAAGKKVMTSSSSVSSNSPSSTSPCISPSRVNKGVTIFDECGL